MMPRPQQGAGTEAGSNPQLPADSPFRTKKDRGRHYEDLMVYKVFPGISQGREAGPLLRLGDRVLLV